MLILESIDKHYGKKAVLNGFSYTFDNSIYALLGSNGAGKSTLMNIIAGVIGRDGGEITLNGISDTKSADYKALIGYMPQQQALINTFTPVQFLGYIAGLKGIKKKDAAKQIDTLLCKTELREHSHSKTGGFSGGMKQRLLFAQAMLGEPEILILDEPTAGLDPRQRVILRGVIKEYAKEHTVIISTHIVSDVEDLASEIIMLKEGNIIESGTVDDMLCRNAANSLEDLYMKLFDGGEKNENDRL